MFTEAKLFQNLDSAIKDISHKVAKMDIVNNLDASRISAPDPCSIYSKTRGDYEMTVALCTDRCVLREMVRNMRRGAEAKDEEIPVYMQEFFNIFFGRMVSTMNKDEHLKVYFDVPSFIEGQYEGIHNDMGGINKSYFYESPYGALEVKAFLSCRKYRCKRLTECNKIYR